jgi:hypothetical protein
MEKTRFYKILNDEYKNCSMKDLNYIINVVKESGYCDANITNIIDGLYHEMRKDLRKIKIDQILNKNI